MPIDVRGNVCLVSPSGRELTLDATGSELRLAVPGWAELPQLGPRSLWSQRRALATALRSLETLRLRLRIDVDGRPAFGLGHGVRTSWLARLLGLASTNIRLADLIQILKSRADVR
jgi:hypothetical protein